jgi:biotin carboxylase
MTMIELIHPIHEIHRSRITTSPTPGHVLLVEPAFDGYELIRRGVALGLRISILTAHRDDRVIPAELLALADHVIAADTNDLEACLAAVLDAAARDPIDAVVPGFEYYVATAAALAAALGCPGLTVDAALRVRDKHLMRQALARAGVAVPRFMLVRQRADLDEALRFVGLPSVAKPIGFAGSIGVRKAEHEADLRELYELLVERGLVDFGRSSKGGMLVEAYVPGPEYSVEGYVQHGEVTYLSITEKLLSAEPYFVEVGHIVNAEIPTAHRDLIIPYVDRVIETLGVSLGPFHAELRLSPSGPVLMEIAARLADDRICELVRRATGVDLVTAMLLAYLGRDVPPAEAAREERPRHAGIRYFIRPALTRIEAIEGLEEVRAEATPVELEVYYAPGAAIGGAVDFLHRLHRLHRLGHAIVVDDDYRRLKRTLSWIDEHVQIR